MSIHYDQSGEPDETEKIKTQGETYHIERYGNKLRIYSTQIKTPRERETASADVAAQELDGVNSGQDVDSLLSRSERI